MTYDGAFWNHFMFSVENKRILIIILEGTRTMADRQTAPRAEHPGRPPKAPN
jgi:hypothetical protein